jgi:1-pyrroline-5-carboxylate dehydrogenase
MPQVPAFATADPAHGMTEASPGHVQNLVAGSWLDADHVRNDIIDPMDGQRFLHVPDTRVHTPFIEGLRSCPKSGLHNPLKNMTLLIISPDSSSA